MPRFDAAKGIAPSASGSWWRTAIVYLACSLVCVMLWIVARQSNGDWFYSRPAITVRGDAFQLVRGSGRLAQSSFVIDPLADGVTAISTGVAPFQADKLHARGVAHCSPRNFRRKSLSRGDFGAWQSQFLTATAAVDRRVRTAEPGGKSETGAERSPALPSSCVDPRSRRSRSRVCVFLQVRRSRPRAQPWWSGPRSSR